MKKTNLINILIDFTVLLLISFFILNMGNAQHVPVWSFIIIALKIIFCYITGLYRIYILYFNISDVYKVILPNIIGAIVYLIIIPGGIFIYLADLLFSVIIMIMYRLFEKYLFFTGLSKIIYYLKTGQIIHRKGLIIGAGEAGDMVLRIIKRNPESNIKIIGFIDDSKDKQGLTIENVSVLGNRNSISKITKSKGIEVILIAMPSAKPAELRKILNICEKEDVQIKIVPSTMEIISGNVKYEQIRDINLEELLSRQESLPRIDSLKKVISSKKVLITGAGGSIGSEIARQISDMQPKSIILLGKGENSIFEIEWGINSNYNLKVIPAICDIRDRKSIYNIFSKYKPDIVFHSAAHKHVNLMERYPEEAFKNNIIGTLNIAEVSSNFNVERFVLISTDKAVYPKSIMGLSKRVAEYIITGMSQTSRKNGTKFSVVRFGNVLGSRGSVMRIFRNQINKGGPVTVTDKNVERYFMTIPEAVHLVIKAGFLGNGGEIFILNMGLPVKIIDIAKKMIRLSGYSPGRDIKIKFTGLKQGEKIRESLFESGRNVKKILNGDIFIEYASKINLKNLISQINQIKNNINNMSRGEIYKKLKKLIKI